MIKGDAWLATRRWADVAIALSAGVLLLPVGVVLAAIIYADDRAAPFVSLERVGQRRARLQIRKFRTMRVDAHLSGEITAGSSDERITTIGSKMRKHRLDEIPQLADVVFGRMAIIGPRPEAARFVDSGAEWDQALSVRPGIAGLTQILAGPWEERHLVGRDADNTYRSDVLPAKLAIDRWYASNASMRVDWIIVKSLALQFLGGVEETPAHLLAAQQIPEARMFLSDA